jgi:hypothetical protein
VDNKPFCFFKLKRYQFNDNGEKVKMEREPGNLISRFDRETGEMKTRVDLTDMLNTKVNWQGDTMEFLLYLVEGNDKTKLKEYQKTFIGKAVFRWKHCTEEKQAGNWVIMQCPLIDEEK